MTMKKDRRSKLKALSAVSAIALTLAAPAWAEDETKVFNIEAQPLSEALLEFSEQSEVNVIAPSSVTNGLRARPVSGELTPENALKTMLGDANLQLRPQPNGSIVLAQAVTEAPRRDGTFRVAQLDQEETVRDVGRAGQDDDEESVQDVIVVTGTNIRGIENSASPVLRFDREAIDRSGFATAGDFIQRAIPQNFASGASEQTLGTARGGAELNQGAGSGVNIRGLGTDSTLVLINGKRSAPSGFGSFVDVSMLPLTAIDRIEILTDGASAIYGSDAVGGVVNFVLRDDFEGAETRLRYGTSTNGGVDEYQVGQSLGANWDTGNALLSYEFYKRDALDSADRDVTAPAFDPLDVLPEQQRHSVFFSGLQELSNNIELYGMALYADRDASRNASLPFPGGEEFRDEASEQINATIGSRIELGEQWQADFAGTYSKADVIAATTSLADPSFPPFTNANEFKSWIVDAKADGPIANLPGGAVRLAIGGQYRSEDLATDIAAPGFNFFSASQSDRDVYAAFGELFIPLVGADNAKPGVDRLELTVAGRFEDYSDFGSNTDPKVGLLYSPVEGLNLRGTWGTSFRAPLLNEIDTSNFRLTLFDLPDSSSASGTSVAAIPGGNNDSLTPEDATTWTLGFDLNPASIPNLSVTLTYFNIEFDDRIIAPSNIQLFAALDDPSLAAIVDRNFDPAVLNEQVAFATALGSFLDGTIGSVGAAGVEVVVDARLQNLARTKVRGLDFNTTYDISSDYGNFGASFAGTYLFEFEQQFSPQSSGIDVLSDVYQPPELRFRGGLNWSKNGVGANAFVNYVDSLVDPRQSPALDIDSYTTVDLQASAELGEVFSSNTLSGTTAYLSVVNVFDEEAPFVEETFFNLNFDGENHDILGRFIAVGLTHRW